MSQSITGSAVPSMPPCGLRLCRGRAERMLIHVVCENSKIHEQHTVRYHTVVRMRIGHQSIR